MYNSNDIEEQLRIEKEQLAKEELHKQGTIPGYTFAVSNDGGKTGVCWRDNAFDAADYAKTLKGMNGFCVVLVKKKTE